MLPPDTRPAADVALAVVRDFVARVKEKALGQDVMGSLSPGQALVGIVHRELAATMGEGVSDINLATQPPADDVEQEREGTGRAMADLARLGTDLPGEVCNICGVRAK